jgi:hypothetical protein
VNDPVADLIVFDWVVALGSTKDATDLLGLPQSSVSRRYRALAQNFGISMRRQHGALFVSGSITTLRMLRELCQHCRLEKQNYRWSWQPELLVLLQQIGRIGSGSTFIKLSQQQWQARDEFMNSRILDLCFEICSDPAITWAGAINLGVHIPIPNNHPMLTIAEPDRLANAHNYPLKYPSFSLPTELASKLLQDGFQLTSVSQRENDLALELKAGPPLETTCLRLPYLLEAGWRGPKLLQDMMFNPGGLEQCVAPLHQAKSP